MRGIVRDVPYANLKITGNSLIIPLGQLKTILEDSNVNAIEIDEMDPPRILNGLASYQMTFFVNFISNSIGALHCQKDNSTKVYRARKITFNNHSKEPSRKRQRMEEGVIESKTENGGGRRRRRKTNSKQTKRKKARKTRRKRKTRKSKKTKKMMIKNRRL